MNDVRRTAVTSNTPRSFELLGEILDARLDVGLQAFGALVLGNRAQHLAQPFETLARLSRLAKGSLRGFVLGAEVGGHCKKPPNRAIRSGCPLATDPDHNSRCYSDRHRPTQSGPRISC